jgi:hypothetical protein
MNATSLADLWVQAAINVDNEEVLETDSDSEVSVNEDGAPNIPAASAMRRSSAPIAGQHRPSMASTSSRPFYGLRRFGTIEPTGARRPSAGSFVPAIFSHTGVRTPPNIATVSSPGHHTPLGGNADGLLTITESQPFSGMVEEKPPPTWSMLPMLIILQYGLLALHGTTHDQIFYRKYTHLHSYNFLCMFQSILYRKHPNLDFGLVLYTVQAI